MGKTSDSTSKTNPKIDPHRKIEGKLSEQSYFHDINDAWSTVPTIIENCISSLIDLRELQDKTHWELLTVFIQDLNRIKDSPSHKGHRDKKMNAFLEKVQEYLQSIRSRKSLDITINKDLPRQYWVGYNIKRQHSKIQNISQFLLCLNVFHYALEEQIEKIKKHHVPVDSIDDMERRSKANDFDFGSDPTHPKRHRRRSIHQQPEQEKRQHSPLHSRITINKERNAEHDRDLDDEDDSSDELSTTSAKAKKTKEKTVPEKKNGWLDMLLSPFRAIGGFLYKIPGIGWLYDHFISPLFRAITQLLTWIKNAIFPPAAPMEHESISSEDAYFKDKSKLPSSRTKSRGSNALNAAPAPRASAIAEIVQRSEFDDAHAQITHTPIGVHHYMPYFHHPSHAPQPYAASAPPMHAPYFGAIPQPPYGHAPHYSQGLPQGEMPTWALHPRYPY